MRATNPDSADLARSGTAQGLTSALIYPSLALSTIYDNIFWPQSWSPWPFGYDAILQTAFAKPSPNQDASPCQQPDRAGAIVDRIKAETKLTADQLEKLQKLGGALGMASGYLAKSCPSEIPAQPVARLQLMEGQIEELTMALDIVREPLQQFEQSLNGSKQAQFPATLSAPASARRINQPGNIAPACGSTPAAIDWSIEQISQSVQPSDAQRGTLGDVKQVFSQAARDLDAHCPTSLPPTALARLESIEARLDATWRAVLSMQVALANFETQLSAEQRDRFDTTDFAAAR
jgi:hypothetical protein